MVDAQRMVHNPAATARNDVAKELKQYPAFAQDAWYLVKELCDVRANNGMFELLVSWEGWEDKEDAAW